MHRGLIKNNGMESVFQSNFFINVNAGIQFNDKKIKRSLNNILALLNTMTNFSKNTYISAEMSCYNVMLVIFSLLTLI